MKDLKILFYLLIALGPLQLRAHQVAVGYSSDSAFNNIVIQSFWNLNENWNVYFDIVNSGEVGQSDNSDRFREVQTGFGYRFNEVFELGLGFQATEETEDITSRGGGLEGSYQISHLWNGSKMSMLNFSFRNLRYEQDEPSTRAIQVNNDFTQRVARLSWIQEISSWLDIELGATNFKYSEDLLTAIVNYGNRTTFSADIDGLMYGFPERSGYLALYFYISEKWGIDFSGGSTTTILEENKTTFSSLDLNYQAEKWLGIRLGLSSSKSDTLENRMGNIRFIFSF